MLRYLKQAPLGINSLIFGRWLFLAVLASISEQAFADGLWPYVHDPKFQLAAFGSLVTYIFSPAGTSQESLQLNKIVLDNLLAGGRTSVRAVILLLVFVIVGALVALIIGSPNSDQAAFMMGTGWTGLVVAGKGLTQKVF